jgi:hypothetical protein
LHVCSIPKAYRIAPTRGNSVDADDEQGLFSLWRVPYLAFGALDSVLIGDPLPRGVRRGHPVPFVGTPLFRIAPDRADFQNAHKKSDPAVTATHRRAQNHSIEQIHPPKVRRAQIVASTSMAVDGHGVHAPR